VQGPLVGNTLYQIPGFITNGSNWSAYGQLAPLSDCGLDSLVGGDIWAVAIVITILNPNFDAYLGVSDSNNLSTVLSNVALNYTHGQGLSTLYIVPQRIGGNIIYFAMPTGLSAHLIFDVVGYFATSQATALDCVTTHTQVSQPNGFNSYFITPACPAGYTLTGGGAEFTGSFPVNWYKNGPDSASNVETQWTAGQNNQSGSTNTGHVYGRCCRIPGR
jgi:hypothetical protein